MKRSFLIGAATLALLGACAQKVETVDREKVIVAIQKAEEAQAAADGRNDLDGAMAVFAEDSTLYVPGFPPAHGRAAIRAIHQRVLSDPAWNVVFDEGSRKWWIARSGDLATTTYTMVWTHTDSGNGKPVTERLTSQTTWARQTDGSWKNVMDINAVYPAPIVPAG